VHRVALGGGGPLSYCTARQPHCLSVGRVVASITASRGGHDEVHHAAQMDCVRSLRRRPVFDTWCRPSPAQAYRDRLGSRTRLNAARASNGEPHMKLTLSVFIALFLFASAAWAQQAASGPTNSVGAIGATQGGSAGGRGSGVFISSGRSSTIRIIGTPTNQPNPGRNVECSPVEQGIVGLIIGPTDLCDR
jgi:hypothetical protein